MSGLVEFLRARYAEHRAIAEAAAELQCDPENGWGIIDPSGYVQTEKRRWIAPHIGMLHEPQSAEHVVANNPAVVLADLDAKCFLLAGCERALGAIHADPAAPSASAAIGPVEHLLRYFAAPYADHPDYREEWKP
jgi:hypothetical protein